MNATYTLNEQFNGIEISFPDKPAKAILEKIKNAGYRWHKVKKVWYAKQTSERLVIAQEVTNSNVNVEIIDPETVPVPVIAEERFIDITDGYLGSVGFKGNLSHLHLYGAELTKAIREDFKRYGITNATVKKHTYSGGQSITITIKAVKKDFVDFETFRTAFSFEDLGLWIYTDENYSHTVPRDYFFNNDVDQKKLLDINAKKQYEHYTKGFDVCDGRGLEEYKIFTSKFVNKLKAIRQIVDSYNYDDSNGQVDYFDRGFYETYTIECIG